MIIKNVNCVDCANKRKKADHFITNIIEVTILPKINIVKMITTVFFFFAVIISY